MPHVALTDADFDALAAQIYASDPVAWVEGDPALGIEGCLKETLWSKQREILRSVRDNRYTAVPTCHKVGKSFTASRLVGWWITCHNPGEAFVLTSAPTEPQVKAILWKEIARMHAKGALAGTLNQKEWHAPGLQGLNELVAYGRKPKDFDPHAFSGTYALYNLVIFDEADGMPPDLWDAAQSQMSGANARFLAIGNPISGNSEFARICRPGSGWNVIQIGYQDTPNFTNEGVPETVKQQLISCEWVAEKRRDWGEDNPRFVSRVKGRFPKEIDGGLIHPDWVEEAISRPLEPTGERALGVDVGAGGDLNVIVKRDGPVAEVLYKDQAKNPMETLGNIIHYGKLHDVAMVAVDTNGVGHGIGGRVEEIKLEDRETKRIPPRIPFDVYGVNASYGVKRAIDEYGLDTDDLDFINLRAWALWNLRTLFETGKISLRREDDKLAAQLVNIKFRRLSSGKIQIESKDDIKKRVRNKQSPDEADALALAMLPLGAELRGSGKLTWGRDDG